LSYVPTGPWNFIKQLQYVEETTYGVTPTTPTFIHPGPIQDFSTTIEVENIKYRQLGSRDIYSLIKSGEAYMFEIRFTPIGDELINYGINLPSGTGTIERSLTFIYSQRLNGTEYYTFLKGCKCDSIDYEIVADAVHDVTMSFICREITTPNTAHGLTTPVFASNPTATPWTGFESGSNPFTFNGNTIDVPRFSFSVTNNLEKIRPNGETLAKFVEPTNREVTFEFDHWEKDTVLIADNKALTARAGSYKLTGASSTPVNLTATFTDMYIESSESSDSPTANEHKLRSFSGTAQAMSIA
jgi:Phage tail tube protein